MLLHSPGATGTSIDCIACGQRESNTKSWALEGSEENGRCKRKGTLPVLFILVSFASSVMPGTEEALNRSLLNERGMNFSGKFQGKLLRREVHLHRALRNESKLGDQERKKGHSKQMADAGMRQHGTRGKTFIDSLIQQMLMACCL